MYFDTTKRMNLLNIDIWLSRKVSEIPITPYKDTGLEWGARLKSLSPALPDQNWGRGRDPVRIFSPGLKSWFCGRSSDFIHGISDENSWIICHKYFFVKWYCLGLLASESAQDTYPDFNSLEKLYWRALAIEATILSAQNVWLLETAAPRAQTLLINTYNSLDFASTKCIKKNQVLMLLRRVH